MVVGGGGRDRLFGTDGRFVLLLRRWSKGREVVHGGEEWVLCAEKSGWLVLLGHSSVVW